MKGLHEDLQIWQRSVAVTEEVYRLTSDLPSDEKFGLVSQMRRSAVSIPSNIAEGYGRYSQKDFKRFLSIALGSLAELHTQVVLLHRIYKIDVDTLNTELVELAKMTRTYIKRLS